MRRSASEIIRELEMRIARLEKSARTIYSPNDIFEIVQEKDYIRIYVGGEYNDKRYITKIKETFKDTFVNEFIPSNGLPPDYTVEICVNDAFDSSNLIEDMNRVAPGRGEKAIQFNLYNTDKFLKNVVEEFEDNRGGFDNPDDWKNPEWEDYFLEWADEYEADTAVKEAVKALMAKYGKVSPNRIDPRTYRLASTRKVAGHIILAGEVNVRQLRRDLEDTFGIEDIDMEDGVLTFLMSIMDNKQVEKQVKALAKKHDVKFEKGDFTGLGMIYTKNASRRNRRASKPMFELKLIKQEVTWEDPEDSDGYEIDYEDMMEEDVYSFEDLLDELEGLARDYSWGEWSSSHPDVSDWITSYEEQDYRTGASITYTLHFNPARGVELDKAQIKMIEKALGMR